MSHTVLQAAGLWDSLGPSIVSLGIAMLLALRFAGRDLYVIKVPDVPAPYRRRVAYLGAVVLLLGIVSLLPIVPVQPAKLSACGAFSDDPTAGGDWKEFDPEVDGGKTLWLSCEIRPSEPVTIEAVQTRFGTTDNIFIGYRTQRLADKPLTLQPGKAERIAVAVPPCGPKPEPAAPSDFVVALSNGTKLTATLSPRYEPVCPRAGS